MSILESIIELIRLVRLNTLQRPEQGGHTTYVRTYGNIHERFPNLIKTTVSQVHFMKPTELTAFLPPLNSHVGTYLSFVFGSTHLSTCLLALNDIHQ